MKRNRGCTQAKFSRLTCSWAAFAVAATVVVLLHTGGIARAQSPAVAGTEQGETHTTLVIFSDRRMEDREWRTLFEKVRASVSEAAAETPAIAGTPEMIRGDAMQPGLQLDAVVVVFLHGDCDLEPLPRRTAFGVPLGWVRQVDGRIEPFVHVDCTRIGQVLGQQAQGLDRDRRDALMGGAIARVILHEWIHIATQSSTHAEHGISRAQFGVADLMAASGQSVARLPNSW
jgi:hypothetical protein